MSIMANNSVIAKTATAAKWSVITEVIAKCITPVTSMILARILAPEAFGILTTILMVIAFAEVFVESGFQKYLVQHKFESELQENQYMSVAFWSNLCLAMILWGLLTVFNEGIADIVGNPGKGHLLIITGVTIPLYSIIGIQSSKIKKELNFKKLFYVRLCSSLVPLFVTIPLALLGLDYWALIIGNVCGVLVNALVLTILKSFVPQWYFSWHDLNEMLKVGVWTLLNGILVWAVVWIDAFLVGHYLTDYYLGLYKNSLNIITAIFSLVSAAIIPVLFSSLSKLQDDVEAFRMVFLSIQRALCLFMIPLATGLTLYSSFATDILLGSQWGEAARIIAINSVPLAFRSIFISLNGDVFRSKGHFSIPLYLEALDLIITTPICFWALTSYGFWTFVYARAFSKMILFIPEVFLLKKYCNIIPISIARNATPFVLGSGVMAIFALCVKGIYNGDLWTIFTILLCVFTYFITLFVIPSSRKELFHWMSKIKK